MLRLLAAGLAGLIAFFPLFWLFTWITGDDDSGAVLAIVLGFLGVPALILSLWRGSARGRTRNRLFGTIGVIWGGGVLIAGLVRGGPEGTGAYAQGNGAGLVFGGLLFVAGLYYLIKGDKKPTAGNGISASSHVGKKEREPITFEESCARQCALRLTTCGGPTVHGPDRYVCENCLVFLAEQCRSGAASASARCGYCGSSPAYAAPRGVPICESCATRALDTARAWYARARP
jgi:hypothetical protein